jgi:alkylmercury lyase
MVECGPPPGTPTPQQAALLAAAFRLLLEAGQPADVLRLAEASGREPASAEADVAQLSQAGRVQRTPTGSVSGCLGLTLEPTRHAIMVDGALLHTWCALDAFGIMAALRATGWIESASPQTGRRLHVDIDAGLPREPASRWVVFIAERRPVSSVVADWCPLVNMFEDAETARSWAASQGVAGQAMALGDTARFGRALWEPRIDADLIRSVNPP